MLQVAFQTRRQEFRGSCGGLKGELIKMPVSDEIHARLTAAFAPSMLEVINDSHRHAGHSGDDGTGESHFTIRIRSDVFGPMTRVARHRAVHQALGDLNARVHAIALDIGA
jgi:BolA family transcriptional regulator, general stress-responsive regulator